jgi:hypothetical protein
MATTPSNHRPYAVTIGCSVSLLVSAIDLGLFGTEMLELPSGTLTYLFMFYALSSVLPIVAALAAYFRRNWARVLLLVLCAADALLVFGDDGLAAVTMTLAALACIAAALLFLPMSNRWYHMEFQRV